MGGEQCGRREETTLTAASGVIGQGGSLHSSTSTCLKMSVIKKLTGSPELDYNFPKEILQTVNNRTEYVTQAYLIHNEAGL